MGLRSKLFKAAVDFTKTTAKIAASPVYVPYKVAQMLEGPSQYFHEYHDGGQGERPEDEADGVAYYDERESDQ